MNKQERKLKGQAKFKKRLKNYGFTLEDVNKPNYNLFSFKTSGRPCSCGICKGEKFNRNKKHKNGNIE